MQSIQWFPGHMAKTRRKITEDLKLVDVVAEIVDARIPYSSANPVLRNIVKNKPKIILLNKSDVADSKETQKWINKYKEKSEIAIPIDCKTGRGLPQFKAAIREALKDQIAVWDSKGMIGRPIRIMVLGIPNVGKSSLINKLIKGAKGKAEVQDKPGVTRQNRWFTVEKGLELLDTPGVLWPKFEDQTVGEKLAFTGAVKDQVMDIELLAYRLLENLMQHYPSAVRTRYKLDDTVNEKSAGHEILEQIGRKRGMLISGGEIDLERASIMVVDEFRAGKLGKITLERADEF
ncbi:ribosome biogenesis GTPase YlqF [Scatolibacter rhodanostii]|uniref:ribosome biogenesis GTPase YlqF n=1 Tax=Scatolibacter rhodanostii TaxID=2014781 RepID=UPI0035214097